MTCIDHTDEVRTIIQKATKDVAIESSLKTYEEVWLSKIFELKRYKKARVSSAAMVTGNQEVLSLSIVLLIYCRIHCLTRIFHSPTVYKFACP